MTRPQEDTVERLALKHGRVAVREGYTDQAVRATVPSGAHYIIPEHGHLPRPTPTGNFSIDWSTR